MERFAALQQQIRIDFLLHMYISVINIHLNLLASHDVARRTRA